MMTAVVAVRAGSQRIKNKNLQLLGDKTLLEMKLDILEDVLSFGFLEKIIVNSDCDEMLKIASEMGHHIHKREEYYASSKCNNSEFYKNLAENIEGDYLMYTPVTAPLIKVKTYYDFINRFTNSQDRHDSMLTATYVKDHMWLDNKPINYNPINAPNTQDLPDIMKLTYGINIISKKNMIKCKNVVGKTPTFYLVEGTETIDIDTPLDFEFAQHLYKNRK